VGAELRLDEDGLVVRAEGPVDRGRVLGSRLYSMVTSMCTTRPSDDGTSAVSVTSRVRTLILWIRASGFTMRTPGCNTRSLTFPKTSMTPT